MAAREVEREAVVRKYDGLQIFVTAQSDWCPACGRRINRTENGCRWCPKSILEILGGADDRAAAERYGG